MKNMMTAIALILTGLTAAPALAWTDADYLRPAACEREKIEVESELNPGTILYVTYSIKGGCSTYSGNDVKLTDLERIALYVDSLRPDEDEGEGECKGACE